MLKIYKSSAGSGKTFTLVKEYLKLCLPHPERFKYIVAITFTKASAAEMKDRILHTLEELSGGKNKVMADQLLADGLTPEQLANAPNLQEKILFNYSDFHVSTIDSFFHGIVRAFHKELNLPNDFEISLEADEAIDFSVDQFLQQSNESPEIHKILIEYIREKISNSQSWNINADLYRIAKELLKDNNLAKNETDIAAILDFIAEQKEMMRDFEEEMDRIASALLSGIKELGLEIEDFKNGKSGAFSFIIKSQKALRDYEPGKRFISGLENDFEWYKKNDPNLRLIEEALNNFLREGSTKLYHLYKSDFKNYASAREVLKNIYTFAVYEEINKALTAYKTGKNTVLISDLTKILASRVIQEEISYIYSKIGSRYDHFLIDEFQDTSSLQWVSLKPLVENSITQGNASLLVGDSKQAIYRWRGGTVELIEKQVTEIDFPALTEKQSLNFNFRSRRAILDFNNSFFKNIAAQFPAEAQEYQLLEDIFEDVSQKSIQDETEPGYVEVQFITRAGRTEESFLAPAREKLLEQIQCSLDDGYSLKDITVLVRDKKDATDISNLLHKQNIPFITQDSLSLEHAPVVRLLLSLLAWIQRPGDVLAKVELQYLYAQYFSQQSEDQGMLLQRITQSADQDTESIIPEKLINEFTKLAALPLYDLVEELIGLLNLNQPDAYLQRFQDAVLEFVMEENGNISGFFEWWDKGKFTISIPDNQDAIRILTVHKAKGLEFPVVMIPFANWDFNSGRANMIWVKPEVEPFSRFPLLPVNYGQGLQESIFVQDYQREEGLIVIDNINLLYVAFTRAKHRLYINTQTSKTQPDTIKSVPNLMNKVLKPELNNGVGLVTFGSRAQHISDDKKMDSHQNVVLGEYPIQSRI